MHMRFRFVQVKTVIFIIFNMFLLKYSHKLKYICFTHPLFSNKECQMFVFSSHGCHGCLPH